jgi:hypothetical protein
MPVTRELMPRRAQNEKLPEELASSTLPSASPIQ